MIKVLK